MIASFLASVAELARWLVRVVEIFRRRFCNPIDKGALRRPRAALFDFGARYGFSRGLGRG